MYGFNLNFNKSLVVHLILCNSLHQQNDHAMQFIINMYLLINMISIQMPQSRAYFIHIAYPKRLEECTSKQKLNKITKGQIVPMPLVTNTLKSPLINYATHKF